MSGVSRDRLKSIARYCPKLWGSWWQLISEMFNISYWTKKRSVKVELHAFVDLSTKVRIKPDIGRETEVEYCCVARLFILELDMYCNVNNNRATDRIINYQTHLIALNTLFIPVRCPPANLRFTVIRPTGTTAPHERPPLPPPNNPNLSNSVIRLV
jgi:hypothetical protein